MTNSCGRYIILVRLRQMKGRCLKMGVLRDYSEKKHSNKPFIVLQDLPYRDRYDRQIALLTDKQYKDIIKAIDEKLEETVDKDGHRISVAGWIPGADWEGTPYEKIYTRVCNADFDASAMLLGRMVQDAVLQRCKKGEDWGCKSDVELMRGRKLDSKTYWQMEKIKGRK